MNSNAADFAYFKLIVGKAFIHALYFPLLPLKWPASGANRQVFCEKHSDGLGMIRCILATHDRYMGMRPVLRKGSVALAAGVQLHSKSSPVVGWQKSGHPFLRQ